MTGEVTNQDDNVVVYKNNMTVTDLATAMGINALDIIKSGCWKHFDGDVVDAFFKIQLSKLVNVFLSEEESVIFDENDKTILSGYVVNNLFDILSKDDNEQSADEKNLVGLFNRYYDCKAGK